MRVHWWLGGCEHVGVCQCIIILWVVGCKNALVLLYAFTVVVFLLLLIVMILLLMLIRFSTMSSI